MQGTTTTTHAFTPYVMPEPKPVIFFDWDGTLADSMGLCIEELRVTLERLGLPPRESRILAKCNGPTNEESAVILDIPPQLRADYLRIREEAGLSLIATHQKLFRGVRDMLLSLQGKAELVIISNGMPAYLEKSSRAMNVYDCFTRIQGCIPGKTKTEALGIVLSEMQPARSIMVGDRLGDVLAGRESGLPTIAACFGYGLPNEWAEADLQAYSVEQLTALLNDFIAGTPAQR